MTRTAAAFFIGVLTVAAAACSEGAREVDYSPQRGYSTDISASLDRGPTAVQPGSVPSREPLGAVPWDIGARHPEGP